MFDKLQGIEITSITSHNATVVEIVYVHPDFGQIVSTGSAKRHPDDRADTVIGYGLALSRALNSLSRKIERRARGRMNDLDQRAKARQARLEAQAKHPAAKTAKGTKPAPKRAARFTAQANG